MSLTVFQRAVYAAPDLQARLTHSDCANSGLGNGNALTHVIDLMQAMHTALLIHFKIDTDDTNTRRVNRILLVGVKFGGYIRDYGQTETLDDNSTKNTSITFADNTEFNAIEIDYYITRGTTKRQGVLRITHDATAQVLDDEFAENNGNAGVTFSLTNAANTSTLRYTTTSTGNAATFNYSIRIIR